MPQDRPRQGANQIISSQPNEPIAQLPEMEDNSRFSDFIPLVYNFRSLGEDIDNGDVLSGTGHALGLVGEAILTALTLGEASELLATIRAGTVAAETAVAREAVRGLMTADLSFGSTGSRVLDSLGFKSAQLSNIRVSIDPSLSGLDLLETSAHESFHVFVAENFPNFAASSRMTYFGAFPRYAEETSAYAYGAISAGRYFNALFAPIGAFGSLSAGQTASVLGTGVATGGLWYYDHH